MSSATGGAVDKSARTIAAFSLVVALFSLAVAVAELSFTFLLGPAVSVHVGPSAQINQYRRVGIFCVFTNSGAEQAVITSAELKWKKPDAVFKGALLSTSLEKYKIEKGRRVNVEPVIYTTFTPLTVKQRDQSAAIVWFTTTDENFRFEPGAHECVLELHGPAGKLSETVFWIRLDEANVTNFQQYPDDDWPVKVLFTKPA